MKRTLLLLLNVILIGIMSPQLFAQDIRALTQDGRVVLLRSNGTWIYESSTPSNTQSKSNYQNPRSAKESVSDPRVRLRIWYDGKKWNIHEKKLNEDASISFEHSKGDAYAMVIAERIQIPLNTLRDIAIDKAKNSASDVRVLEQSERVVNGKTVLFMRMDGTIKGIAFTFYGYYYCGAEGSVQFVTYTAQNLFNEYKSDFDDLLNGMNFE